MASEWIVSLLGDIYEFSSGLSKNSKEFGFGFPFLTFKTVFQNFFVPDILIDLANTTEAEQSKHSIRKGDVFLTRTSETLDELGMSCVALKDYPHATFNGFTKRLRPKAKTIIDPKYAGYYFRSQVFRSFVTQLASMTTRASLNNDMLATLPITIPSLAEQMGIGNVLYALDQKIELNRKVNKTLEDMARAIFKSWFVDFDPVRAKASGHEPISMAQHIAALFPDSFEGSELGEIPKGWQVTTIRENAKKISKGTTPTKSQVDITKDDPTIPFLKVKDLTDSGDIVFSSIDKIPRSIHEGALKRSILQQGDVLFTIAGTIGRVAILPPELDDSNANQAIAFIRPFQGGLSSEFIRLLLKTPAIQTKAFSVVVQGVQANVSLLELGNLKFACPTRNLVSAWELTTSNMFQRLYLITSQIKTLADLRNTLLSKLISGELRIPDAERIVGRCV